MSEPQSANIHPEFNLRVNDFIEMANRVAKRFDTEHAQVAMMHAFARYSAHHYHSVAPNGDAADRQAYIDYISTILQQLMLGHLDDLAGPAAGIGAAPSTDAPAGG